MSAKRFDELVSDALDLIPGELAAAADNVVFLVSDRHPEEPDLLGLYEGIALTELARLFREELGTSFRQWRQLVVLSHALPLLARGTPVSEVAAASGYASESAFTAMFKAAMGQPPTRLRAAARTAP